MRLSQERTKVLCNETRIRFFLNYSNETQKKRANYWDIKKRLMEKNTEFFVLDPAKLTIIHNGTPAILVSWKKQKHGWMIWMCSGCQGRRFGGVENPQLFLVLVPSLFIY